MPSPGEKRRPVRFALRVTLLALLLAGAGAAAWHAWKPLPPGLDVASAWAPIEATDVEFLADVTSADAYGQPIVRQQIFDSMLQLVANAHSFIVVDMFLFNSHHGLGKADPQRRPMADEFTNALIAARQANPALRILVSTDPINDTYGALPSKHFERLRAAGIEVIDTDLDALRDSNPLWSGFWRAGLSWWLAPGPGNRPNPFEGGGPGVSAGTWARLFNFKANHRKVLITDLPDGRLAGIVTSANVHDASSRHSNVALRLQGAALAPLLESEQRIAAFSGWTGRIEPPAGADVAPPTSISAMRARVLTEAAIQREVVARLNETTAGDAVDLAYFYLSDRTVMAAIRDAASRGANVRVLLDPNKDAFGRQKSGIPNRSTAAELLTASDGAIRVRWYRTHGEQFHSKLLAIRRPDRFWMTLGSANLTRRNLDNINLEANLAIEAPRETLLEQQVIGWFDELWENRGPSGVEYTADAEVYAEPGQLKYWAYRLMEATGLSSF